MNSSKNILILSLIFFILCLIISSVNTSVDSFSKNIRYMADEDTEEPILEQQPITKVDCGNNTKCDIENMECEDKTLNRNCTCKEGYFPNFNNETDAKYCEIKQKKQLTAFLLELFVGFGAGHFYRHEYLMASLKLVAFFIGIYLICLFPLAAKCVTDCCDNDCVVIIVSIFFYLYALGLAFWYIWDLVYFGKNKYQDCSHGDICIDLQKW